MQDRELVAAIVNGDPDGLAEAYDRYAASVYAYCRSMLPDPRPPGEAADAVADTFTIAAAKLEGLRDPDQLGSWLHAVARNECLRRLGAAGLAADAARLAPADAARLASGGAVPRVSPPGALRERVLQAGADNTPTGRADRVSVTHRAGAFDRTGFPKPIIPPGPRWWHEVRRRPRATAGAAAVAVAVVAGGIAVLLIAGGTHRARASTVALGGGNFGTSAAPSIAASSQAGVAILAGPQAHARIGIAEHGNVPHGRAHGGPEHVAGRPALIRADPVTDPAAVPVPVTVALPLVVASADPGHPAGDAERAGAVRGRGQAGQRDVHRESGGRPGQLRRHQLERQGQRVAGVRVAECRRLLDHGRRDGAEHGRVHRESHR